MNRKCTYPMAKPVLCLVHGQRKIPGKEGTWIGLMGHQMIHKLLVMIYDSYCTDRECVYIYDELVMTSFCKM